jgi:hypothetical protein
VLSSALPILLLSSSQPATMPRNNKLLITIIIRTKSDFYSKNYKIIILLEFNAQWQIMYYKR